MSALAGKRTSRRDPATRPAYAVPKLAAFVRRDLRIALSYRMAVAGTVAGLAIEVLVLSWIGKLVAPDRLPEFHGVRVGYMEFATIGIAVNLIAVTLLYRVATAIRNEQLQGTLESLLCTPTPVWALQLGSAASMLAGIPLRLAGFVVALALVFGLHYDASGIVPAAVIVLALIPSLWGLGLAFAGGIVTFKRGAGATALVTAALGLASGAFFPLSVLPHWLRLLAQASPLTIAIDSLRDTLIGGTTWAGIGTHLLTLVPLGVAAMLAGSFLFRLALRRERRNGTLGLY